MKRFVDIAVIAFLVVVLPSCSRHKNKLPINQMKLIMWDMVCADEMFAEQIARDTSLKGTKGNIKLYEQVFLSHQIPKDVFYGSLHYYQSHPDEFKILMDSVQNYGNAQRNNFMKIKPKKAAL